MELDVVALSKLLNSNDYQKSDNDNKQVISQTPATAFFSNATKNSNLSNQATRLSNSSHNNNCTEENDYDAFWTEDEINQSNKNYLKDPRQRPKHEIFYKQKAGTEDIFMHGSLNAGSKSCSHIVVKIYFPCAKSALDLDLEVKCDSLVASSRER